MGRPRRPLDGVADSKDVRAKLKEKGLEKWKRQRLTAVLLGLTGKLSLQDIAGEARVSPRTVGEWYERFRDGGLESLLIRKEKGKGPASWLDARALKDFRAQLAQGKWRRAEDARTWLQQRLKRELSLVVVYKYLGKIAARRGGVLVLKGAEVVAGKPKPTRKGKAGKKGRK